MNNSKQILTTLVLLGGIVGSLDSDAATFKRFWRGYPKPGLSSEQFVSKVNDQIIPATRELFKQSAGLVSYQPVISNMQSTSASPLVPEEFALLQYESEAAYKAYRATDAGKAYGDLHWEMFDQATSKSAVVEAFTGKIETTHAYDLLGQDIDWKRASTYFQIHKRNPEVSETEFLAALSNSFAESRATATQYGLQAAIVLVMPDHIAVYEAWDAPHSRSAYEEALNSDMPSGEPSLRDVSQTSMDIQIHKRPGKIWPGEGTKILAP
jgi:quinol monooxygenase YgiN